MRESLGFAHDLWQDTRICALAASACGGARVKTRSAGARSPPAERLGLPAPRGAGEQGVRVDAAQSAGRDAGLGLGAGRRRDGQHRLELDDRKLDSRAGHLWFESPQTRGERVRRDESPVS
ncbi:hypothetical protein [Nannocystis exedens]|uniref:hypothetical protein n=1 Tax=Nannocystis exedens TaxID=54 RepID=UPI0011603923|nr:hypothetical protein [Nannocystis exedens]